MGWGEPDATSRGESPEQRKAGATRSDARRHAEKRATTESGRPQATRSLPVAGRAEAPSPRPPRKRRREMPTSGKPAAECGGGDTEWKAKWRRRRPGAKGRARSPRPPRRAALARGSPPASLPALPHRGYSESPGRPPAASPPALGPVAAVQEPLSPLQVGPRLA